MNVYKKLMTADRISLFQGLAFDWLFNSMWSGMVVGRRVILSIYILIKYEVSLYMQHGNLLMNHKIESIKYNGLKSDTGTFTLQMLTCFKA